MQKKYFDIVVIGAGSGGLTAAVGLSKAGKRVLLIEREHLGGECSNTGCIPSKALLHHAKQYWNAKQVTGDTDTLETYRQEALAYVKSKVSTILEHETLEHFETIGITIVIGEAEFTGLRTIKVDGTTYTFKRAVIATGSSPRLINIDGLLPEHTLTNQNIFDLTEIPKRLLIIGSGPIGLEMGQAFAMLGSQVTIATIDDKIGKLEDEAIRPYMMKSYRNVNIRFEYETHIRAVENSEAIFDRSVKNTTESFRIPFDKILIAIGRSPNLPDGLDVSLIAHTPQGVTVDKNYRTTNRYVYALGDVADRFKFTHVADKVAREVVKHIISRGLLRVRIGAIPKVTYLEPEIAQVGLSWNEAVTAFGTERLYRLEIPLDKLDRAVTDSTTEGKLVVITKRLSGKILGVHMAGPRAGEIIALFNLAIDNKISLWRLGRTIYAYPTYAQIIKLASTTFFSTQLTNLKTDSLSLLRRHLLKGLLLLVWAGALLWLFLYLADRDLAPLSLSVMLFDFITQSIWGPLLFIITYAFRPLTFLPATAMTVLAGTFFGLWWGVIYTIIGANLGATLAYIVGRFFSSKTPALAQNSSLLTRFGEQCRTAPFLTVLIMRLLFLPYDLISYGAGVLRAPYVPYIFATVLGTLLGTIMFVSLGAAISVQELMKSGISTDIIDVQFLFLSALIFSFTILITKLTAHLTTVKKT